MNRYLLFFLIIQFVCSSAVFAKVIWQGDFETGDISQWSKAQATGSDRLQIVTSPVNQGKYALRVLVRQGDNPIGASGNRNELLYLSYEPPGSEYYYRWQTMWDPSFPSVNTWQLFTQWHHSGDNGSPPIEFYVYGDTIQLRINASTVVWSTPLERGKWHDFIFHVKWSPNSNEGFIELWFDGNIAIPKMNAATQFPGMTNYLKQGLYRNNIISQDGIVYHDGFTVGETMEDVQPSVKPPPLQDPEPQPDPEEPKKSEEPDLTSDSSPETDFDSAPTPAEPAAESNPETAPIEKGGLPSTSGCGGSANGALLSPFLLGATLALPRKRK
jgi:hypothetical protein